MNKKFIFLILLVLISIIIIYFVNRNDKKINEEVDIIPSGEIIDEVSGEAYETIINSGDVQERKGLLESADDLNLQDVDGKGKNYTFLYDGETYNAKFNIDTWSIYDSYKITNLKDLAIICEALIDIHPIPSKDGKSYRVVEDLVQEWNQHNVAYRLLPSGNSWKESSKDVDLDPADQGKSLKEMYESRTGKDLNINVNYHYGGL